MNSSKPRIVVLGGGFAGLNFVKHIDKDKFDVVLVDRHNYHSFPPLFYQVASSEIDPSSICFPFRRELSKRKGRRVSFHMGSARSVDVGRRCVTTDCETIPYDKLVIAFGTTNNFFGNDSLKDEVYTLKSNDQAIRIRNEILYRCERASIEPDREKRRRMLTFVVIGGGPAGVEMAGAIGELKRYIIRRDYPDISPDDLTISLYEGRDKLLATMSEKSSETALSDLQSLMVDIHLGRQMKSYADNILTFDDGSTVYSEMVIWTAGVTGRPLEFKGTAYTPAHGGRYPTDRFCRVEGLEDIFAIGDVNLMTYGEYTRGLPQLAQVAIQQGRFLAENLNRDKWDKEFTYNDKGSMATIGRNRAVVDMGRFHLDGFIAWMAWMFIHLISLLGMRNKISVLVSWFWAYFSYNTALRLLLAGSKYPKRGRMWDKG